MKKERRNVSWFNENKGFGFIISQKDDKLVFTSAQEPAMRAPKDAVKVQITLQASAPKWLKKLHLEQPIFLVMVQQQPPL